MGGVGEEMYNGGFGYFVEVNGLTITGWRKGTRAEVRQHALHVEQFAQLRAQGSRPSRNADGSTRVNPSGRVKVKKPRFVAGKDFVNAPSSSVPPWDENP